MSNTTGRLAPGKLWALLALVLLAAVAGAGLRARDAAADGATNGTFSFATTSTTVTEGQTAFITVNRTGGLAGIQVINLAVTPNAPATYADINSFGNGLTQITFDAGVSSRTIDATFPGQGLPTIDNATTEASPRSITIVLASVQSGGGVIGAQNSHTLNIVDNDGLPKYSFQAGTSSQAEGSPSGTYTINIPVVRTGSVAGTDTVTCALGVGSTATGGGVDFALVSQNITFTPSDPQNTIKNCVVTIVRDTVDEPAGETVVLQLSGAGGFSGGGGAFTTHTLTITDDDGSGTMQFSAGTYNVSEGAGTANVTVTRTGGTAGSASVLCTYSAGSAISGSDFTAGNQTVFFSAGQSTSTCAVPILNDGTQESQETVFLQLSNPTGATLGSPQTATLLIDDDDGTGNVVFSSANYSGAENGGVIVITVNRLSGTGSGTVAYATSNGSAPTAIAGSDYVAASGTLTWGNGEVGAKTFTVTPLDDGLVEGTENITLTLSNPTGGLTLGSPSVANLALTDNESPGPVITSISPNAGTIIGGTPVTINGTNFTGATFVTFDGISCTSITVNPTVITCVTPAHVAGTVEVVVSTPFGNSPTAGSANDYTYTGGPTITSISPNTGPTSGNTIVTITGTGFTASGTTVRFGGTLAVHSFIDVNTIVAVSPARSAGVADVTVTTPGGTTPNTTADDFTYTGSSIPVVTTLTPNSGSVGAQVVITGSGFTGATSVTFGAVSATFTVNNDGQITANVPSGTPLGVVDVRVTTPSGTSANTTSDNFTNTSQGNLITYTLFFRFTLIVWTGPNGISAITALRGQENPDNPNTNNVSQLIGAIWRFDPQSQTFKGYFPGSDGVPGANDFTTLTNGQAYFIALLNPGTVTWTTLGAN